MKNLKDIIQERLHINKDTNAIFNEILEEGEECKFKDIDIYKTNCRIPKVISDRTLINEINKYFSDNDLVFLVTKKFNDTLDNNKILEDIKPDKKAIMQKVYSITGRVGFYIKNVPSINGICLIKNFFGKKIAIEKTQYIFKINQ